MTTGEFVVIYNFMHEISLLLNSGAGSCSGCRYCKIRGEYSHTLNKMVYLGHRSFLHRDHPLHEDEHHFSHQKDLKSR